MEDGIMAITFYSIREEPGMGHNIKSKSEQAQSIQDSPHSDTVKASVQAVASGDGDAKDVEGIAGARLKSFIERVERLEEEKRNLAADIKEIYAEAKAVGFDTKTMRKIVSLRKMDSEKRDEEDHLLDLYRTAIGME